MVIFFESNQFFNFSAKGWTAALSYSNIKFVRFGLIFSGTSSDNSNVCGYQGCVDNAGEIRISVAWFLHIFLMTFVSRLNRGIYMKWWLQFIEKASTSEDCSSGFKERHFWVCLLMRLADKSISGIPKVLHTALFIFGFNFASAKSSVAAWNFLEFLSASRLFLPEMCTPNPDFFCNITALMRVQATFFVYIRYDCSFVRHSSYMLAVFIIFYPTSLLRVLCHL